MQSKFNTLGPSPLWRNSSVLGNVHGYIRWRHSGHLLLLSLLILSKSWRQVLPRICPHSSFNGLSFRFFSCSTASDVVSSLADVMKYSSKHIGQEAPGSEVTSASAMGNESTYRIFSRLYNSQRRGVDMITLAWPVMGCSSWPTIVM